MKREDVVRIAKEVYAPHVFSEHGLVLLERFAALVAAAEREACAKLFDGEVWAYDYREIAAEIRARGEQ